jgi:hypothetical protein
MKRSISLFVTCIAVLAVASMCFARSGTDTRPMAHKRPPMAGVLMLVGMACMAGVAVKFQVFRTSSGQDGTENCDYTGDRAPLLTKEQGDNHRTIPQTETDPADENYIEAVREWGPKFNEAALELAKAHPAAEGLATRIADFEKLEGKGDVALRVVLMDS